MKLLVAFSKYVAGSLFALLVGMITTPIITRLISVSENGKYSMFVTVGSMVASFLYFGMDQSYIRYYNDESDIKRDFLFLKCLFIPIILLGSFTILLLSFNEYISAFLVGEKSFFLVIIFITQTSHIEILAMHLENSISGRFLIVNVLSG